MPCRCLGHGPVDREYPREHRRSTGRMVARGVPAPDEFVDAYIAAALWSSTDDDGEPLDANYSADDIAPECLRRMERDCQSFYNNNRVLLETSGRELASSGHDFWLTRERHGTGFWDRDLGEVGEALTDAAHAFGEVNLYVGDDGQIHC